MMELILRMKLLFDTRLEFEIVGACMIWHQLMRQGLRTFSAVTVALSLTLN